MQRKLALFLVPLLAATLWGCGSNRDTDGTDVGNTDDLANIQTLGIQNCTKCHSAATPQTLSWLQGTHGNANARPSLHLEGSSCQPCHNQLLDGENMETTFPAIEIGEDRDGNPVYANQNRDMISCESCHGGGSAHRGVGPIPTARPDWEQCRQCHDHPEGIRHSADYGMLASNIGASAHNNADDLHASTTRCQRCHTAEGSVQLAAFTGDSDVMHLMDDLDPIDLEENLHPVTCAACHVPHTDELRADSFIVNDNDLASGNWDPNGNGVADQFDFCTSCHTYYNQDGVLIGSGSEASGTAPFYHNTAWYRVLPSTHFDNPATSVAVGGDKTIEGYVIRQDGATPCFDCHGHELRTNTRRSRDVAGPDDNAADFGSTIHTQWASSAHAGGLLTAKYAAADANPVTVSRGQEGYEAQGQAQVDAVMAAGAVDAAIGNAWSHYDWDTMRGGRTDTGRQECQHCHTATGAANFLGAVAGDTVYDPAANDFSHLEGWTVDGVVGSDQNELLYCWGCHSNAQTGVMRTTKAIPLDYQVDGADVSLTAPDAGTSAACLSCHSGRGNVNTLLNGQTTAVIDPAATTGYRAGGTSTHYMTAGATIYQAETKIGYTFGLPAESYADPSYYAHDTLGCADCHMTSANSHSFAVVAKDETTGAITQLVSTKCVECHTGAHGAALVSEDGPLGTAAAAAAFLEEEAEGYHEALEILAEELAAAGTVPSSGYPYFIQDANGDGVITDADKVRDTDADGVGDDYPVLAPANEGHTGAMHNYSYLHHETGAFAHNRLYAKRLIYDSLDWLDNGAMDESVTIDAVAHPSAAHWLGASRP